MFRATSATIVSLRLSTGRVHDRPTDAICSCWLVEGLLYVHGNRRFIRDGSPGRPPRLSHSSRTLMQYVLRNTRDSLTSSGRGRGGQDMEWGAGKGRGRGGGGPGV